MTVRERITEGYGARWRDSERGDEGKKGKMQKRKKGKESVWMKRERNKVESEGE